MDPSELLLHKEHKMNSSTFPVLGTRICIPMRKAIPVKYWYFFIIPAVFLLVVGMQKAACGSFTE